MRLLLALAFGTNAPRTTSPTTADTVRPLRWEAALAYGIEAFQRQRSAWQTATGTVGYHFPRAALLVDLQTTSRFGQSDQSLGAEAYFSVGRRLAGYARAQVAPGADVLPRTDLQGGLDHAVGGGWELGANYRRMGFAAATIDIVGLGANKYLRNWYFQVRGSVVPEGGRTGFAGLARARRFLGSPQELVEVSVTAGKEVVLLGAGVPPEVRGTSSVAARLQRGLAPDWGFSLGASWNSEARVPGRYGVTLALRRRW